MSSKPTLGHPTRTAAVMALLSEGKTPPAPKPKPAKPAKTRAIGQQVPLRLPYYGGGSDRG